MKLGIVGLPNAGKTTVFNALTHAGALATAYAFSSAEANHGVVAVPDARLDRLNEVLQTPREVHATIEVVDIPAWPAAANTARAWAAAFCPTSARSTPWPTSCAPSKTPRSRFRAPRSTPWPTSRPSRPSSS